MILWGLVSHKQKFLKDYYFCIILCVNHLHSFENFRVKFFGVVKNDCQAIVASEITHVRTTVEKPIFCHEANTTVWSQPPYYV